MVHNGFGSGSLRRLTRLAAICFVAWFVFAAFAAQADEGEGDIQYPGTFVG